MGHIFISYSRRDIETVDRVVQSLKRAGMDIWIDREDILTGNSWRVQIVEAIDTCDAFVLMLSEDSAASPNVHKEVILAADAGRRIMVMMLEPVKIPAEIRYQLAGLQVIDVQMVGFDKGVEQLKSALEEHLKKINQAGEKTHSRVELVIQGVDLAQFSADKQEQLLAFIANLSNTDRAQLNIASMTAGSVHVFVDMPAGVAYLLMSLALNGDARFASLGIASLRMDGAGHFIYTANGALIAGTVRGVNPTVLRYLLAVSFLVIALAAMWIFFQPGIQPRVEEAAPPESEAGSPTPTFTPTAMQTATPSTTPTPTPTSITYEVLGGVIAGDNSACNYGPGSLYLNDETLRQGIKLQVLGRDINSTWAYVQADGYPEPCWVSLENIVLNGEVESLEPVYPGKVTLLPSSIWPAPKNVITVRSKSEPDKLSIYWDAFILADGDLESPTAPRYLLELWLCRDGVLTFTPVFAWENSVVVDDEAGCSEPSHGVIYLSEKHGYPGPVAIPWEAHP